MYEVNEVQTPTAQDPQFIQTIKYFDEQIASIQDDEAGDKFIAIVSAKEQFTKNYGTQAKDNRCFQCGRWGHWRADCRTDERNYEPEYRERAQRRRAWLNKKRGKFDNPNRSNVKTDKKPEWIQNLEEQVEEIRRNQNFGQNARRRNFPPPRNPQRKPPPDDLRALLRKTAAEYYQKRDKKPAPGSTPPPHKPSGTVAEVTDETLIEEGLESEVEDADLINFHEEFEESDFQE